MSFSCSSYRRGYSGGDGAIRLVSTSRHKSNTIVNRPLYDKWIVTFMV